MIATLKAAQGMVFFHLQLARLYKVHKSLCCQHQKLGMRDPLFMCLQ